MSQGHFIQGQWVKGTNPFTGMAAADLSRTDDFPQAGEKVLHAAVLSAREALQSWQALTIEDRMQCIDRFIALLEKEAELLATIISRETGKIRWDAEGEIKTTVGKWAITKKAYAERCRQTEIDLNGVKAQTLYKAHGVTAVFGPFNFPFHLPNGHILPALLSGNTVIFKPSELAPLCGEMYTDLFARAELPAGVFNLIQGKRDTGKWLASHPGIDGVYFTGSAKAGIAISKACAEQPQKILALELGGNNPLVIDGTDKLDAAVMTTILSAFISSGQRCTCARRLIIIEDRHTDKFIEDLVRAAGALRIGEPFENPAPFIGPLISPAAAQHSLNTFDDRVKAGGRVLLGMNRIGENTVSPGIVDCTGKMMPDEECFGPLLQVYRVKNLDAAIKRANDTAYGLSAALLSDDEEKFRHFLNSVRAGVINWNRPTTGASGALPFGGVGTSGNHRPSGYFAVDYCNYPVASLQADELSMPALPPGLSG